MTDSSDISVSGAASNFPSAASLWDGLSALFGGPKLIDHNGRVLTDPAFSSIFAGGFWQTKKGLAEKRYHDNFAEDILKSDYTKIWSEYGVNEGSFKGSSVNAAKNLPERVGAAEIESLIQKMLTARSIPSADGKTVYTVYLPPGIILESPDGASSLDGLGGFHGSFDLKSGKRVYYAALVYSQGGNGIPFTDSPKKNISIIASHEWSEAVTDPDVNNGELGWYDERYGEIGDIPLNMGLPLKSLWGYVDGYAVQKEWSNKDNRPEVRPKD